MSHSPRRACPRQEIVLELRDGSTQNPFAHAHGNSQPAGNVQDPALCTKKLEAHLRVIAFLEEHANMTVEEIKAARDNANPQLAR